MAKFITFKPYKPFFKEEMQQRTINVDYIFEIRTEQHTGQKVGTELILKSGDILNIKLPFEEVYKMVNG